MDRDVVAEFKIDDFIFEQDLVDALIDADRKAVNMARRFIADDTI